MKFGARCATVVVVAWGLSIGEVSDRSGVAPSALRFYEDRGLLTARRTESGRRRYAHDSLRRVAFIRAAQRVGLTLEEIAEALSTLPDRRSPTKADWAQLSRRWRPRLDEQLESLQRLRDQLDECIGCGCLSLRSCALSNPSDRASSLGPGARFLLGDRPEDLIR